MEVLTVNHFYLLKSEKASVAEEDMESKKVPRLLIPLQSKTCQKDLDNQRRGNRHNFEKPYLKILLRSDPAFATSKNKSNVLNHGY